MPNFISEDQIEKAAVALLRDQYGYRTLNGFTQDMEDPADRSNRVSKEEVVLYDVLKAAAVKLNPAIPEPVVEEALEKLTARRYAMSPLLANKEVYGLIRDGIPVQFEDAKGRTEQGRVRVIDFGQPSENDFCAVTQLWIKGDHYPRRPDILVYVNGLPLVFVELKNSNVQVRNAYDDNLINYKKDIPLLFQYNAFCVLSNAVETRVGSCTAGYEFFFNWLRPEDETEKIDRKTIEREGTSLERLFHGILPKERLLDYIENFILFHKESTKIVAQNHQFIGVNKAIASFEKREEKGGKLGVFWHTQGSGKSFSMIFLARKVFHRYTGNYTFVIVTDREDLDGQIYRNFLDTGTVQKNEAARPRDSAEMRDFLGRNKRLVFTLIQKFRFDKGKEYPLLSDRDDIIVIVDEAHRTQYAALAENMRTGLPMWLTGFDAPTISTLYLDKPMKDHTLMQAIARANRVTSHTVNGVTKTNGEVVDYYNVFRSMKKALSDYAQGDDRESPVQDKENLFDLLDDALLQGTAFCDSLGIALQEVLEGGNAFGKVNLFQSFADRLLEKDAHWKEFKVYENTISALYEACKPEILAGRFRPMVPVFQYLRGVVDASVGQADIDAVKQRIGDLLDQSVVTSNSALFQSEAKAEFRIVQKGKTLDLSKLDFDKLKEEFKETEFKHIGIANLREFIVKKLEEMLRDNRTRTNFAEKFQEIVNRYNAGGMATENYFDELVKYAEGLKEEDERHTREGLTKDELELFDILKREKMTQAEEIKVKNAARHLLKRLVEEQPKVLVQDWYKDKQSQLRVKTAVEEVMDRDLPETYDQSLFKEKSAKLFELIYDYASKGRKWAA